MRFSQLVRNVSQSAFLVAAAACGSPTDPVLAADLRLDAPIATRVVQGGTEVGYTVVNQGISAVRIMNRCGDHLTPTIEQRLGRAWQPYSGGACLTINDMSPVSLEADAQRSGTVMITQLGQYRISLNTDRGRLVSATFTIR